MLPQQNIQLWNSKMLHNSSICLNNNWCNFYHSSLIELKFKGLRIVIKQTVKKRWAFQWEVDIEVVLITIYKIAAILFSKKSKKRSFGLVFEFWRGKKGECRLFRSWWSLSHGHCGQFSSWPGWMAFCVLRYLPCDRLSLICLSTNNLAMWSRPWLRPVTRRRQDWLVFMKHFSTKSERTCKPSFKLSESINNFPTFSCNEVINQSSNDKLIVKF